MRKIIVAGIGTSVGKTVVSAILCKKLGAKYWKPVESGKPSDTETVTTYLGKDFVYPPVYSFENPLSPHHAARLENVEIKETKFECPQTDSNLIIEMAGGIYAPLREDLHNIDLFSSWDADWIVVSKHYLGSINHTLLTWNALKEKGVSLLGIVFNGRKNPDTERAILHHTKATVLGQLEEEKKIQKSTIEKYAMGWQ